MNIDIQKISFDETVKIFPKRKDDKFGVYPGVEKIDITPMAIPSDQKTAIAESSRIACLRAIHSTPIEESKEKIKAESIGFKPR